VAQGLPPRRSARLPERGRRGHPAGPEGPGRLDRPVRQRSPSFDELDEDVPPWAGPGIYPSGPGRRERRPPAAGKAGRGAGPAAREWADQERAAPPERDESWHRQEGGGAGRSRRAATKARKSRRRLVVVGGLVVVAIVVVLGVLGKLPFQGKSAPSADSGLVTTFQPGEFHSVPNACQAVSAATLSLYLPGKLTRVAQSADGAAQSQCTWTLDARPDFRVLTVNSQAYTPSLLATGDGSATFSAIDAYGQQLQALQDPAKSSKAPKAQIGGAVGLGRDAFTALQVFRVGGDTTDEVTVVVRDKNVLVTVTMQGQEKGGGFGPVPVAALRAAALAAAHEALAGIR
jgi:hypothetical protein